MVSEAADTHHMVNYDEIAKMGGLLRCSTMPLQELKTNNASSHILMVRPVVS